jgi:hypothetical protein
LKTLAKFFSPSLPINSSKSVALKKMKDERGFFMAFTSLTTIKAAGALQISSDVSGKETIEVCMSALSRAHDEQAEHKGSSNWDCEKAGIKAYLKAVPPLSGYRNICDFIACINYASMIGLITHADAAHYLANARIALSAIYHQPKPIAEGNSGGQKDARKKAEK